MTHKPKNKFRYFVKLLAVLLAIIAVLPNFACIAESSSKSKYNPAESEAFDSYLSDSIPVIRINTDDGHPIDSKTEYKTAGMTIENNNYYADCQNSYTKGEAMPIEVRGRGNSTWDVKDLKVSLKLKLPEKESLLGMDESRHWYLLANYYDDDINFIMSRIADISEHYIEQQEYLYYQGFLDGMESKNLNSEQLKNDLCILRG